MAGALFMRLDAAIARGGQVEEEMQHISDEIGSTDLGVRELTSLRFYLQELLWASGKKWSEQAFGLTNYVALIDAIEFWRLRVNEEVTYVTFNYDLLLEDALNSFLTLRNSRTTSQGQRAC